MASDVRIGGHEYKRWQVAAVGIGGGAVALFVWWRHKNAAGSTPGTPAAGATPADSTATGDLSGYGTTYGPTGNYSTALGYTSGGGYASNADWAQAVEGGLVDIGYSPTAVASAIGRYLGRLALDPDQQNIVHVALAEFGGPPSGALPIIAAGQGPAAPGGHGPAASVSGGHVVSVNHNDATVAWTGKGTSEWKVTLHGPGPQNGHSSSVGVPQATYSGLEAGHHYSVTVQPLVAGKASGHSGTISFVTKKGK